MEKGSFNIFADLSVLKCYLLHIKLVQRLIYTRQYKQAIKKSCHVAVTYTNHQDAIFSFSRNAIFHMI